MKCLKCKSEEVHKIGRKNSLYIWECASCGCRYLCSEDGKILFYQETNEEGFWHPL